MIGKLSTLNSPDGHHESSAQIHVNMRFIYFHHKIFWYNIQREQSNACTGYM